MYPDPPRTIAEAGERLDDALREFGRAVLRTPEGQAVRRLIYWILNLSD